MARRILVLLALMATLLAGCATLGAVSAWLNDRVALAPPQLQRSLDRHYPRTFDRLGGLVSVTLANPRLSIPQGETRLRLDFDVGVATLGGRPEPGGRIALASGLRYEPSTQGLHLDAPELLQFDLPGAGSLQGGARGLLNTLLAELARSEPVYRLEPDLLAKLPPGRRVGDVAIERGAVVVHLDR
jgi:hypothetical protein